MMADMGSIERTVDRATRRADRAVRTVGAELRDARRDRNLSLATVGRAVGRSAASVSRIERGLVPEVSVLRLAQLAEVVGLELSVRAFVGSQPIRDAAHLALLQRFHGLLHPDLRWSVEVPFPVPGDQRAWDAIVGGSQWRYGVEAETAPRDGQALARRLAIRQRDALVDGVLLVLPRSRRVRAFLAASQEYLGAALPVAGPVALARLAAGVDPGEVPS